MRPSARLLALAAAPAILIAASAFDAPRILPNPPAPHAPGAPYAATGLPDRITLTPGADPARSMGATYRTDARQTVARAQIARAAAGSAVDPNPRVIEGETHALETENGLAHHHLLRFDDLEPGAAYSYRVEGPDGWSGWIDFRTARDENAPFQMIYFGDMQNQIAELGARVARQALRHASSPALIASAGDLVSSRDDMIHDDEWAEWWGTGGMDYAAIPHLPAPGNHEYVPGETAEGERVRVLGAHWPVQFALPDNGAEGVEATSYYIDHQGVRFIIADATAAIDLGGLDSQTDWIRRTASEAPGDWTIVVMHQPIITCARPENTDPIHDAWKPVFEETGVDLVLQGHDHCYARWSNVDAPRREGDDPVAQDGPVYMVSVAGAKMYGLNTRVANEADRWAEATQLYQILDITPEAISVRAYSAQGALYDAFELRREADGSKTLSDDLAALPPIRVCEDGLGPDGFACNAPAR